MISILINTVFYLVSCINTRSCYSFNGFHLIFITIFFSHKILRSKSYLSFESDATASRSAPYIWLSGSSFAWFERFISFRSLGFDNHAGNINKLDETRKIKCSKFNEFFLTDITLRQWSQPRKKNFCYGRGQ